MLLTVAMSCPTIIAPCARRTQVAHRSATVPTGHEMLSGGLHTELGKADTAHAAVRSTGQYTLPLALIDPAIATLCGPTTARVALPVPYRAASLTAIAVGSGDQPLAAEAGPFRHGSRNQP